MSFKMLLPVLRRHISIERHFRYSPVRFKQTEIKETEIKEAATDEPIKYSTSKAGKWKAIYSSSGELYDSTPRIQPLVVVLSLTAFMVYFCMLREENDLDDWLRELETNSSILVEEARLQIEIRKGKSKGNDVSLLHARLEKIKQGQAKASDT